MIECSGSSIQGRVWLFFSGGFLECKVQEKIHEEKIDNVSEILAMWGKYWQCEGNIYNVVDIFTILCIYWKCEENIENMREIWKCEPRTVNYIKVIYLNSVQICFKIKMIMLPSNLAKSPPGGRLSGTIYPQSDVVHNIWVLNYLPYACYQYCNMCAV